MNRHSVQRQRIGPAVRRMRRSRGLTLDELADEAEVSPSHLSRLERSQTLPSFPVLAKIADALGVDVNEFVRLEQDVAELDAKLSVYAGLLALDDEARHGLLDLSIEARRDLVERIDQLSTLSLTPVDVQDRAVSALDAGADEHPLSAVGNVIEQAGLDAIALARMLLFLELMDGPRRALISGPSLLPIAPGQDLVGSYRWAFSRYPIDPPIADWWSRPHDGAASGGFSGRQLRAIVTTSALDSPLGPVIARSLLATSEAFGSAEIAVTERSISDVNLLSVGSNHAILERITDRRGTRSPDHVAIWLCGNERVGPCDDVVDRLWSTLNDEERSREAARTRLQAAIA